MSEALEIAHDDAAGRALAAKWSLDYVESYAISVDPRALSLLLRSECKRLRAVPLAATGRGAVVAVAAPSEERFDALRALAGDSTRFVIINDKALDALLSSRMFADGSAPAPAAAAPAAAAPAPAAPAPVEAAAPSAPTPVAPTQPAPTQPVPTQPAPAEPVLGPAAAASYAAPAPAPIPVTGPPAPVVAAGPVTVQLDDQLVDAIVSALEKRLPAPAPAPVAPASFAPAPVVYGPAAEGASSDAATDGSAADLLAQVDGAIGAWNSLRGTLAGMSDELEETKRLLRDTKEQLSVSHAENDQHQRRVRSLEIEVSESRSLVAETRARLHDAAEALESGAARLEETSADLL